MVLVLDSKSDLEKLLGGSWTPEAHCWLLLQWQALPFARQEKAKCPALPQYKQRLFTRFLLLSRWQVVTAYVHGLGRRRQVRWARRHWRHRATLNLWGPGAPGAGWVSFLSLFVNAVINPGGQRDQIFKLKGKFMCGYFVLHPRS